MRKVKLAFWVILVALLFVVGWQNQGFFLEKRGIGIDYVVGNYHTPELQIALYFLIFFLVGLLIAYFSSLSERFVARKTIRRLHDELSSAGKKISDLEATIASQQMADSNEKPVAGAETAGISEASSS